LDTHPSAPPLPTKLIVSIVLLVIAAFLLFQFSSALNLLIIAIILAFLLNPLTNRISKLLHLNRTIAIVLAYTVVILVMAGLTAGVVPLLISEIKTLSLDLQLILNQALDLFNWELAVGDFLINGRDLLAPIAESLQGLLEPIFGTAIEVVSGLLESLATMVFILIISFYFVKDGAEIITWFEHLVLPDHRDTFREILAEINLIWGAFFRGQLLLAIVATLFWSLTGSIIGLRFAIVMGVIAGMMEFIPSIGHAIWFVIATILALVLGSTWLPLQNWAFMLLIWGLHVLYTQIDLNYLIPRIIGRSVHLRPVVVILGIIAGATLAGVLGVVLAAPTIATARLIGRYIYCYLFDTDFNTLDAGKCAEE
jgi:predicted PurR-regulated permease PerM